MALLEEHIANQASLQLVYKVTERVYYVTLTSPPVADNMQYAPRAAPQIFALYCKTRNFVAHFAQMKNRALFQNMNEKKILVLDPSSRVGFEGSFKTASSQLKKYQNWTVSLREEKNFDRAVL